jgi:hypothetical protein
VVRFFGTTHQLQKIDDNGDCTIAGFDFKGCVTTETVDVECKLMMSDYVCARDKSYENADYPGKGPLTSKQWSATEFMNKLTLGLSIAARHYGDMQVLCRSEPRSAVFALQKYKKGELVLVPCTSRVKIIDVEKETEKQCNSSPIEKMMSCGGSAMPTGYSFHLCSAGGDLVCPAWFVQGAPDIKDVNLKVTMVDVDINAKIGQTKATTKETSTVALPIFINTKSIDVGIELKFYKPAIANAGADKAGTKRPFDAM